MVDCFDRIAVQMTEQALEPVTLLRERSLLAAVTLRMLSGGRRFNVTISKTWPAGASQPPAYIWSVNEVDENGVPRSDGFQAPACVAVTDPEAAYWVAIDAINHRP